MTDWMRQIIDRHRAAEDEKLRAMGFPVASGRRNRAPAQPTTPDPTDPAALARRIAGERGLPLEAWTYLRGSTRAEVEADADRMIRAGMDQGSPYSFEAGPPAGGVRDVAPVPQSMGEVADQAIREALHGGRAARGGPGEWLQMGGVTQP